MYKLLVLLLLAHSVTADFDDWFDGIVGNVEDFIDDKLKYFEDMFNTDKWHCGSVTAPISSGISRLWAHALCMSGVDDINNACLVHDKCYEERKGQKHCDDIFCRDLEQLDHYSFCKVHIFCLAVRNFGEAAYNHHGRMDAMRRRLAYKKSLLKKNKV